MKVKIINIDEAAAIFNAAGHTEITAEKLRRTLTNAGAKIPGFRPVSKPNATHAFDREQVEKVAAAFVGFPMTPAAAQRWLNSNGVQVNEPTVRKWLKSGEYGIARADNGHQIKIDAGSLKDVVRNHPHNPRPNAVKTKPDRQKGSAWRWSAEPVRVDERRALEVNR